jgi:hypothetical protein
LHDGDIYGPIQWSRQSLKCSGEKPAICVDPAYVGQTSELAELFAPTYNRIKHAIPPLETLVQVYTVDGAQLSAGEYPFEIYQPSELYSMPENFLASLIDVAGCSDGSNLAWLRWDINRFVSDWLLGRDQSYLSISILDNDGLAEAVGEFAKLNEEQKIDWFNEHFSKFATCTLEPTDFAERPTK